MPVNRPRTTDELLTGKLVLLGRLLSQSAAAVYRRRFGLGQEEWRIVARLGSQEGLPLKELGRRASLRKSQISRAAASLIARRLLSRRTGEEDAREARLHLTARGRRVQQEIVRTAARRSEFLARTMTKKELATLQRQLDRLLVRASELLRESE
ncbi:MAG: MarR family winged helix-turn-helix transcriptional regulator [Betaproteobacteria bacterium]